jgi:hypothetical protein
MIKSNSTKFGCKNLKNLKINKKNLTEKENILKMEDYLINKISERNLSKHHTRSISYIPSQKDILNVNLSEGDRYFQKKIKFMLEDRETINLINHIVYIQSLTQHNLFSKNKWNLVAF